MAQKTPAQSISSVRTRIHSTTSNYPDNIGIEHYNRIYKKVISKMRLLDDEYFYNQGTSNRVIDQQEYTATAIGVTDITRILTVSVKYSATDELFTPCRPATSEEKARKDYYAIRQPKIDPFWYIQDNSIWIYPVSEENVTGGLLIEAIIQPPSLLTTDTADKVVVPERVNEVIEDGMTPFALEYVGNMTYSECMTEYDRFLRVTLRDSIDDLSLRGPGFVRQGSAIQSQFR